MVENAEELKKDLSHLNEQSGPIFKIKSDPRLTKVGFLSENLVLMNFLSCSMFCLVI